MPYKGSLFAWALLSPIMWIVLLIVAMGNHTDNLPTAFAIGILTIVSLMGSLFAFMSWSKSDHFFKSLNQLEEEIEECRKTRLMYTRKLEELNTQKA